MTVLPFAAVVTKASDLTPCEVGRFWSSVAVGGPDDCWPWLLARTRGYGIFYVRTKARNWSSGAHRIAYVLLRGPVKDGLVIDHLCRNRSCCNPRHMEPVTNRTNVHRGNVMTSDSTTCRHGHEYTPENTRIAHRGEYTFRQCRACTRRSSAAYKARRVGR